jgi:hypothetical protein
MNKEQKYIYAWKNNKKRAALHGRHCQVIVRMRANSALVEFENGQREIISRNALRKVDSSAVEAANAYKIGVE